MSSGARTLFKVTFPLIWPGIFSGALFAFVTSLDEVVVVQFLGGETSERCRSRCGAVFGSTQPRNSCCGHDADGAIDCFARSEGNPRGAASGSRKSASHKPIPGLAMDENPVSGLRIDGRRLWATLMDMAEIGATTGGGSDRQALTDEDRMGRDCFGAMSRPRAAS